jgi:hypothetical protein
MDKKATLAKWQKKLLTNTKEPKFWHGRSPQDIESYLLHKAKQELESRLFVHHDEYRSTRSGGVIRSFETWRD